MDMSPGVPPGGEAVELPMRLRLRMIPLGAMFLLVACSQPGKPSLDVGETAPTNPPPLCQPTVKAASRAEPLPPETGLAEDVLFDMVASTVGEEKAKAWWKWFTVEYPEWSREGWTRLDKARGLPPCAG